MAAPEGYDLHVKLLMLGDSNVGKTSLLLRYAHDSFSPTFITTIGIDFKIKYVDIGGTRTKLQIWDTAGQERFRTITVSYFKGAHGILLVYDISERETFENIRHWLQQIRQHADEKVNVVLIGNKLDKADERGVSTEEGKQLADEYNLDFFETSAKSAVNVDAAYDCIAKSTKNRFIAMAVVEFVQDKLCFLCAGNPKKAITYGWFTAILLVLVAFILACVVASASASGSSNQALGFAAVWTVLLLIALSVGGTLVMRQYSTALNVGFFLGVIMVMAQQMLIIFAIFVDRADSTDDDDSKTAQEATASFSFFLFVIYGIFALMLYLFKDDIIKTYEASPDTVRTEI